MSYTIKVMQNEKILKAKDTIFSDQSALQMPWKLNCSGTKIDITNLLGYKQQLLYLPYEHDNEICNPSIVRDDITSNSNVQDSNTGT